MKNTKQPHTPAVRLPREPVQLAPDLTFGAFMKAYDALELEIFRATALTKLVAAQLSQRSDSEPDNDELFALSLVTESIFDKLELILEHAGEVHAVVVSKDAPTKGGAR